ncbi:hypothetical protein [Pinibacter aurantiacus]|uniref:Uncharacterized protein n=1 Tax=Pinibacter aurantiacus TaxID=2851599 RepID=A0A9E2SGM9_9BACT|nr:hypothetical protein [Pinibacter aurantiacus]MBV4360370.1 hypothetical protein [Pinibacter aurantiacus]
MFSNFKDVYTNRQYAKEARQKFLAYFADNFPPVKSLKCKIDPHNHRIIASAKFCKRRLYARGYSLQKCFNHFVNEYEQKVLVAY